MWSLPALTRWMYSVYMEGDWFRRREEGKENGVWLSLTEI